MEMKNLKGGGGDGGSMSVTSIPSHHGGSQDIKGMEDMSGNHSTLDRRRNSFNSKCGVFVLFC